VIHLRIGNREAYYSQIQSGGVTVLPEYNGNLLIFVDKNATAKSTADVDAALKTALPSQLEALNSAKAEDKDSLTVTKETATQNNLNSMADLAPVAGQFTVGGPPEFESRWAKTFQSVYGLNFKGYKALDVGGPLTVKALKDGDVQVANLFTTDPAIIANDFVVLEDPKSVFPAQNVTPLVNKAGINQTGKDALNAISAKLDTPTLADLVKQVVTDLKDPEDVAKEWLSSQGLV
jgi:osmoprotectant transport system substrate-binding protein